MNATTYPRPINQRNQAEEAKLQYQYTDLTAETVPEPGRDTPTLGEEPKAVINLELLLHIEKLYEDIIELLKRRILGAIFNKCTEWWDVTAQLNFRDYGVFGAR